jgi:hypothetical protein
MKDQQAGVRIGCFGGFWGDSMAHAVGQFLRSREAEGIDYLVSDYLAEVTMCILAKKKQATLRARKALKQQQAGAAAGASAPAAGKVPPKIETAGAIDDFALGIWKPFGQTLMQKGIKVVVNAGGLDPLGLKAAVEAISAAFPAELRPVVAAVVGDDLLAAGNADLLAAVEPFTLDGGQVQDSIRRPTRRPDGTASPLPAAPLSANAYLGCGGIVAALRQGAHVVITGRVVDSALILGPLVHEHGWSLNDGSCFDLLAAGTAAGHIIECGAQCTGGNFTDWELAAQTRGKGGRLFENIGFPLVEVQKDGTFIVTKPSGTGGIVSRLSVAEQLVYEIGDPKAYIVADVACDFRGAKLEEVGKDRVKVSGIRGQAPSGRYKVTATYADGYLGHSVFAIVGPNALYKARAIAQSLLRRAERTLAAMGQEPFRATRIEYLGAHELSVNGGDTRRAADADEVVVRLSVHHSNPKAVMIVPANIPSGSTGGPPGLFALNTVRPSPSEAVAMRSGLVPVARVGAYVSVGGTGKLEPLPQELLPTPLSSSPSGTGPSRVEEVRPQRAAAAEMVKAPLYTIACCRSGDKADAANVGVVCRKADYLPHLLSVLTPDVVRAHLAAWFDAAPGVDDTQRVQRFVLPGVPAVNFVLSHVLGGGGVASLKADKQGKCIGSLLSGLVVDIPAAWARDYDETVGARKAAVWSKL